MVSVEVESKSINNPYKLKNFKTIKKKCQEINGCLRARK